jgi:hypothetical protein
MAHIAELPDDFEESLNLNKAPQLDVDEDAVFEEMYYNRFAKKGPQAETNPKSFEEAMQEISKMPLFMNNLNDIADAGMQNGRTMAVSLQMLRSICRWRECRIGCHSSLTIRRHQSGDCPRIQGARQRDGKGSHVG